MQKRGLHSYCNLRYLIQTSYNPPVLFYFKFNYISRASDTYISESSPSNEASVLAAVSVALLVAFVSSFLSDAFLLKYLAILIYVPRAASIYCFAKLIV